MSPFVIITFFLMWAVIPTALESLQHMLMIASIILTVPSIWMLVIWVDRVMLSRREGRPA